MFSTKALTVSVLVARGNGPKRRDTLRVSSLSEAVE